MLTASEIKIGRLYSARFPKRGQKGYWNDRRIVSLRPTVLGIRVEYRSPAVPVGHPFTETYTEKVDNEDGDEVELEKERTIYVPESGLNPDSLPASVLMGEFLDWAEADVTVLTDNENAWRR